MPNVCHTFEITLFSKYRIKIYLHFYMQIYTDYSYIPFCATDIPTSYAYKNYYYA